MSQEPVLKPISFDAGASLTCAFAQCQLPTREEFDCVVIAFAGLPHYYFMPAMIGAAIAAWKPDALILDLRKLEYDSGDEMGQVLAGVMGKRFQAAVVASELNRQGLTSLFRDELLSDPKEWLFDTLADALSAVDRKFFAAHPGLLEELREKERRMAEYEAKKRAGERPAT